VPAIATSAVTRLRIPLALCCLLGALWMASALRGEHRLSQAGDTLSAGQSAEARRLAASATGPAVASRAARITAEAALQQGDLAGAERAVEQALRSAPNDWSLHRDRAVLLLRLGRSEAARRAFGRALALNPHMVLPPHFSRPYSDQP
jgi:Flp pilus assembly protein TadD